MKDIVRFLLCSIILTTSACAIRPDGGNNGTPSPDPGDDDDPGPRPDAGTPPTNPPPDAPPANPTGNGKIACVESGSQTNVTISNGILAHLTSTLSGTPGSGWTVVFDYGGTESKQWQSDAASYTLTMPNTVSHFTFVLKDPNGTKYWFDLNEYDVTGTCSHATNAGDITHSTSGTTPGNGTVTCSESGSQTTVSISPGVLSHLFDSVSPNSNWTIECGYGCTGSASWQGDGAAHTFTASSGFSNFSLVLREPGAGNKHWFDVSEYAASGTCSKGTNEFLHTPGSGTSDPGNGTISCANVLSGQYVDVTFSSVASHLKKSDGSGLDADGTVFPDSSYSLRWGSDQSGWGIVNPYDSSKDQEGWFDGPILLRLPGGTVTFNAALYNPNNGGVYWLDLDEFNVTGDCSHPQGAGGITHGASGTTGNGSLSCTESGSQTNVTISNGILSHLVGVSGVSSPFALQFAFGGVGSLSWNGDAAAYTFSMSNTISNFNFDVRDTNGNLFRLDVNEFTVSGTCSKTSGAFTHSASSTTNVGTIKCRLWDVGGIVKREVSIIPNGNGILAGTFQDGSPLPSPEAIRLDVDLQQQTWVGNTATYFFYPSLSINNFNFFVADNNDVAGGSDTLSGGDYFNLASWSVINETTIHGTSNCHVVGGGININ